MAGTRHNTNKPIIASVSPHFIYGIGRVLSHGMEKYGRNNWMRGLSFTETLDSLERHLQAMKAGMDVDSESGLLHLDHVGCNTMFLRHFMEFYDLYRHYDDRAYTYQAVAGIVDGLDSPTDSLLPCQ